MSLSVQIVIFLLLQIPQGSTGIKSRILRAIGTSPKTQLFILIQSIFLVLAFILYLDNKRMEAKWVDEKAFLLEHKNPGTGTRNATQRSGRPSSATRRCWCRGTSTSARSPCS